MWRWLSGGWRPGARLGASPRGGWNWPVLVLLAGFALAMPWQPVATFLFPWFRVPAATPFASYEHALQDAAIKRPDYVHILRTIDTPDAELVSFRSAAPRLDAGALAGDVWAAVPDELRRACAAAANPSLRLEQVLGLPPRAGPFSIFPIKARRDAILRPCMSGDGPTALTCRFDMPAPPAALPNGFEQPDEPSRSDDGKPADDSAVRERYRVVAEAYKTLNRAYGQLRFVASQIWQVHRSGFPDARAGAGDYPYTGYPFTGMGWTYDWNPSAATHSGVTEFIVPQGTPVTIGSPIEPAKFCSSPPG